MGIECRESAADSVMKRIFCGWESPAREEEGMEDEQYREIPFDAEELAPSVA